MTSAEIQTLLSQRSGLAVENAVAAQLVRYLELLVRWNTRTNLSAIREPAEMVVRHFGESLQCANALPEGEYTLLDYGSGGGFPGAVVSLARPKLSVTLAESQGKKVAFLQEVCRTLRLNARVHAGRVDTLPTAKRFSVTTLRAVDKMEQACREALARTAPGGLLVLLTTDKNLQGTASSLAGVEWQPSIPLTGSERGIIAKGRVAAKR